MTGESNCVFSRSIERRGRCDDTDRKSDDNEYTQDGSKDRHTKSLTPPSPPVR